VAQIFLTFSSATPQLQHFEPCRSLSAHLTDSIVTIGRSALDASIGLKTTVTMDAAAIQSCIVATLDPDADVRRRAELQLKQVRRSVGGIAAHHTIDTTRSPPCRTSSASAPPRYC
jgi:hypothetical protein